MVMVSRYALLHNVVVVSANMAWQVSHYKQWSFKRMSTQRFVITEKILAILQYPRPNQDDCVISSRTFA